MVAGFDSISFPYILGRITLCDEFIVTLFFSFTQKKDSQYSDIPVVTTVIALDLGECMMYYNKNYISICLT